MRARILRAGEDGVADVVIDLGELPHGTQRSVRPTSRPPLPVRPLLAFFGVVLVATLTGAVHLPAPAEPATIPAQLGDMTIATRDHFFVVASADSRATSLIQNKIITTYGLPAADLQSTTPVAVSGAVMRVDAIREVLLVSQQADTVGGQITVAVVAGTGRVLWRQPSRLIGVSESGRLALLLDNGAGVGPMRWYGIDPSTGVVVWSQLEPVTGSTELIQGSGEQPSRLVTATVTGALTVRDPETGAVTASASVPAMREWSDGGLNIWVVGDLIMLGGRGGINAYGLRDLAPRWSNTVDLTRVFVLPVCGEAICLFGRFGGLTVLDRDTGDVRWAASRYAAARRAGAFMLVSGNGLAEVDPPLVVLDAADGSRHGDFGPWRPVGEARPDGRIAAILERPSAQQVSYALLDPATLAVRVLGTADGVSNCEVHTAVLICRRLDSTVGVWPLSD
jgi:outer membrane protein assembly factor BamB